MLAALLTACVGLVAALGVVSASADEPQRQGTWYPGLPFAQCMPEAWDPGTCERSPDIQEFYTGMNVMQTGMTGSAKAKQWARVPISVLAANSGFYVEPSDVGGNASTVNVYSSFVSPAGSKNNYGDSSLVPIRTVAFGSIPAEVTLQVSQRRDSANFPIPIHLTLFNYSDDNNTEYFPTTTLEDRFEVVVKQVKVDGVDVGLSGRCTTGPTAHLRAESEPVSFYTEPGYVGVPGHGPSRGVDDFDPAHGWAALQGGTLNGTIDVPRFSGCTTRIGDDISRLLTSAVSGDGNPITLRVGSLDCQFYEESTGKSVPPAPGTTAKTLGPRCPRYFDTNPRITPVPAQLDIPNYAPGDAPD